MSDLPHPIVELRQYTLRPGQRDALIDLFDLEFVETQEAVGNVLLLRPVTARSAFPVPAAVRPPDRPHRTAAVAHPRDVVLP